MEATDDPADPAHAIEIVGRVSAREAAQTLAGPTWQVHAIVLDPETQRPATLVQHTRYEQALLVEEPAEAVDPGNLAASAGGDDAPGPWPDA